MESITLTAPDISCEHCQHAIEEAVGALNGVSVVSVEIPTKLVYVSFDPAMVSRQGIESTMNEEGFPVSDPAA